VKHNQVKKLVLLSAVGALVALGLMILSILAPKPIYLVLAMSVGQGIGTLSLALYLLAIVLDLQGGGAAYEASLETERESGVPESKSSP
jgi:hypothetical protein